MTRSFLAFFISVLLASSCDKQDDPDTVGTGTDDDTLSTVAYEESRDVILNPERGFMHTWAVQSGGEPVSTAQLQALKSEDVSIILRIYYLKDFKNSALSENQLTLIKTDFERFRQAGIKCVLRFAYTDSMSDPDAPLDVVENHIDQLSPIVSENADIIAFVQAGFIGAWGEWHSSSNDLTTLTNKKIILEKLLSAFPPNVKIQVRTPGYKKEIFGESQPMDATTGYGNSNIARVGFHNDCFMASIDDYGTYQDVAADKQYISQEALYVPTGGETCPPSGIPIASCTTAENEMELLKWTYLNLDYYGPVLNEWRLNSCFENFQKRLGYRIVMEESVVPKALVGPSFDFKIKLGNVGFAPVYINKNTFLVLKSTTGTETKIALDLDVRKIAPGSTYEYATSVNVVSLASGEYSLFLDIQDEQPTLADRTDYKVRLANNSTWESTTGYNNLMQTIKIE